MRKKLLTPLILLTFSLVLNSQNNPWKKTTISGIFQSESVEVLDKDNSEVLSLDFTSFKTSLQSTPLRGISHGVSGTTIILPDEKGDFQEFKIFEAPVFSPSLSAKFPEIKSYVGYSTDNSGAVLRMSVSPKGVQTMISYKNRPTVFMQPLKDDVSNYVVYNRLSKRDLPKEEFICSTADDLVKEPTPHQDNITQRDANDQTLRKFRLAISVNGEYTTYHGGTVAGALAAINATMARVNAVFETDMAITFEVQDFPELIYTNAATDPYSNSLSAWNVELQNTLTNTIGNAAYDIGHMFGASGGGGNAGCIGCVCVDDTSSPSDENKGAGITSPADGVPQGDTFDIDYVAHEIGHQMGALHTWSHSGAGGAANIEPGSGSTIMGYAGITGSDVQPNSDPYFSYYSILQITDNVTNTRLCWQDNSPVTLTNNPPVANAGSDVTIPQGTAYVLRGSATDADSGDTLMYCWEQNDDGVVTRTSFGPTLTSGAMARSLPPTTASNRYIPKLSRVVAGQLTETNPPDGGGDWETVSTVGRDLNWALTVRDRNPTATGLGGQTSFDLMKITVDASSGPFVVTSQTTNEMWNAGSTETVTWDVAGTNTGNVNTPKVNILLSIDGGMTFPYTVASDVDNDGSHTFTVPATGGGDTTQARIIVEGKDNIFYAMNSSNFSIQETEFAMAVTTPNLEVCSPNDAVYTFTYNTFLGFTGTTTFSATGLPANASVSFNPTTAVTNGTMVTATVSGIANVATGLHSFKFVGTSGAITKEEDVSLNVFDGLPGNITLSSPTDGQTDVSLTPTLTWDADATSTSYDIEVATDNAFTDIVSSGNVSANSFSPTNISQSKTYYWRVRGKNICGDGSYSSVFSFTALSCNVCTSSGNNTNISTTLVNFNTINNATANSAYTDYTSIKTTVKRGESHSLTVNVNTNGFNKVQVKAWIDWNQDCVFNTSDEEYDLGSVTNNNDVPSSNSPLSITIPNSAVLGDLTMRISVRQTDFINTVYPTSCMTNVNGEVEDYTLTIEDDVASVEDFAFNGFNLYPNPTKGEFTLKLELINTDKVSLQLFDVRGRLIGEKNYLNTNTNFSEKISFNNAKAGLYLLKITNGNKQTTRKLIIN